MPKKQTKTLLIILLLIDILSIGAFIYLYNVITDTISNSVDMESSIKTELKEEDTRTVMKDDIAKGKIFQEKLTEYIVPSGGTVEFIKTVEKLVSNSGLKSNISSVTTEAYDKGSVIGAEYIKVTVEVIGEWKNIQLFLKSLENYPLKIDIRSSVFNKVSDYTINGKKVPQWSAGFDFTVVKMKDTK